MKTTLRLKSCLALLAGTMALSTSVQAQVFTSPTNATTQVMTAALAKAADGAHRTDKQKARNKYRNPAETLSFFGLKPGMSVVEIGPGGGWYTSVLAPAVGTNGVLYAAHNYLDENSSDRAKKYVANFKKKVAETPIFKNIKVTEFHPVKSDKIAPPASADMVLTFRNVHNWYMGSGDEGVDSSFKAFYKALKPGGVLGVVEHRLPENRDQTENKRSGYMKQSYVVAAAKKAGFKLAASSDINANPKDTANHPKGVWTLPPRLALDDVDRKKYMAIGESDRMTLKFIKPAK